MFMDETEESKKKTNYLTSLSNKLFTKVVQALSCRVKILIWKKLPCYNMTDILLLYFPDLLVVVGFFFLSVCVSIALNHMAE